MVSGNLALYIYIYIPLFSIYINYLLPLFWLLISIIILLRLLLFLIDIIRDIIILVIVIVTLYYYCLYIFIIIIVVFFLPYFPFHTLTPNTHYLIQDPNPLADSTHTLLPIWSLTRYPIPITQLPNLI